MEKRGQLEKNLDLRMVSVEEEMSVFRNLTDEISKLKEIVLALAKETTEKITYATVYTMYQREYSPDSSLTDWERTMVVANVKEIYQDINSYTRWLKWKKKQEENRGQLKWSEWTENEVPAKKNNDDCYLLRE